MSGFDSLYDICVVGAGASGMMAAICAARLGVRVCLLERNERVGKKILKTGNGRCNLSHIPITGDEYRGSGAGRVREYLDRFSVNDTLEFFKGTGLLTRQKDGYVYPYSENASAVLDVLRFSVDSLAVNVRTVHKVTEISGQRDGVFNIICSYEDKEHNGSRRVSVKARRVIMCTGGCADPATGSDGYGYEIARRLGLKITKPMPALVRVNVKDPNMSVLAGVRAKGCAGIIISDKAYEPVSTGSCGTVSVTHEGEGMCTVTDRGEIQFTKDGLSGIPIFNLSRYISKTLDEGVRQQVDIDLVPDMDIEELSSYLSGIRDSYDPAGPDHIMTVSELMSGTVNKKISIYVFKRLGISPDTPVNDLTDNIIKEYAALLKHMEFEVTSVSGFEYAQVTAGGVDFSEVDEDLQCVRVPGLFLAGELLDIDGPCGGYNLQWAWTSGNIAATGAVRSLNYHYGDTTGSCDEDTDRYAAC